MKFRLVVFTHSCLKTNRWTHKPHRKHNLLYRGNKEIQTPTANICQFANSYLAELLTSNALLLYESNALLQLGLDTHSPQSVCYSYNLEVEALRISAYVWNSQKRSNKKLHSSTTLSHLLIFLRKVTFSEHFIRI